ncbi:MAG: glycosyltransferase family 39 protein [bacterium]|nr:MAG: glycosyltransferase family 39 protein [bacterium]
MTEMRMKLPLPENRDIIGVLLFLALALRLWFSLAVGLPVPEGPQVELAALAQGGDVGVTVAPLYVLFLRTVSALFGPYAERVIFSIQGIAGAAVVILLYYIAARISSMWIATVTAVIAAIYPYYLINGLSYSYGTMGMLAVTILVLLAVRQSRGRAAHAIAGCIAGVAILTAPITAFFMPGFALVFRRRGIFLLCVLIVLVPWTLRNSIRVGMPVPVYGIEAYEIAKHRYRLNHSDGVLRLVNDIYNNASVMVSRGGVAEFDDQSDNVRSSNYMRAYSYVIIMILAVFGLLKGYKRSHRPLLVPVAIFICLVVFFSLLRRTYRILSDYIVIFYAAVALRLLCSWFRERRTSPGQDQIASREISLNRGKSNLTFTCAPEDTF